MNEPMPYIDAFIADMATTTFKAGDVIFQAGETYDYCYMVVSGIASVYILDSQGVIRRVMPIGKYQFFPSSIGGLGAKKLARNYAAYTDLICVKFTRAEFHALRQNPNALYEVTLAMSKLVDETKARIETLVHPKAETKILFLFKYFYDVACEPTDNPDLFMVNYKNLSQERIGATLGLTRETTGKAIAELMNKHILYLQSKRYIINKPKLMAALNPTTTKHSKQNANSKGL